MSSMREDLLKDGAGVSNEIEGGIPKPPESGTKKVDPKANWAQGKPGTQTNSSFRPRLKGL